MAGSVTLSDAASRDPFMQQDRRSWVTRGVATVVPSTGLMAAFLSVLLGVACAQDRVPSTPIVPPVLDGPFTLAGRVVSTQTGNPTCMSC